MNHNDILSKRNEVDETWLVSLWMEMTKEVPVTLRLNFYAVNLL